MLRNLFILMLAVGFVFVLYSMTAQNANATCGGELVPTGCEARCLIAPTCLCSYGNDNHLKPTYCDEGPTCDDFSYTPQGFQCRTAEYAPEAVCGRNEDGQVIPTAINNREDYCRNVCTADCETT